MIHSTGLSTVELVLLRPLTTLLLPLGSVFSLLSLSCALAIATARIVRRRLARGRRVGCRFLIRVLFPRWLWLSPSTRADAGLMLFNVWVGGLLFGWALVSASAIQHWTAAETARLVGPPPLAAVPTVAVAVLGTLLAYVAYEFGYWVDHYASHTVPALWSFHKVHHTAEVLTPLTVFRVHPVETLKLANILAVVVGSSEGLMSGLFGLRMHEYTLFGRNAIMVLFFMGLVHLQHSHAWIRSKGGWSRLILSPAHHQLHHSADPAHFGKNLGSFLAIWDWAFGTLLPPQARPASLRFGVPGRAPHTVTGALITPFVDAARSLGALVSGPPRARRLTRR